MLHNKRFFRVAEWFYLHIYKQLIAQLNFSAAELSRLCHDSFDLQFFIVESIKEWNKATKSSKFDADETKAIVVPLKVPPLKHLPPFNFRSENLLTNLVQREFEGRNESTIGKKSSVSFLKFLFCRNESRLIKIFSQPFFWPIQFFDASKFSINLFFERIIFSADRIKKFKRLEFGHKNYPW